MNNDQDLADRLNEAAAELRLLPLGGRGHLADICLEAAAALRPREDDEEEMLVRAYAEARAEAEAAEARMQGIRADLVEVRRRRAER